MEGDTNMNIYKIIVQSDCSADHEYRVSSLKEIVEFVTTQFADVEHLPNLGKGMIITTIPPYIQKDGAYMDNPDWKT